MNKQTESGFLFGSGRANWHQIVPYLKEDEKERAYVDFHKNPKRMVIRNERVKKVSAGFSHTIFLTASNKLYALGMNNHGQCGSSNLTKITVTSLYLLDKVELFSHLLLHKCDNYNHVYTDLDEDEQIIDIAAGKSHNIFITNKNRVFMFGATLHNQLMRNPDFDIDQCSPSQVLLNMEPGEVAVAVKAGFDRSAVLTNKGGCYVWGGEDLTSIGAENYAPVVNLKQEIGSESETIKDIALGYFHTLVTTTPKAL